MLSVIVLSNNDERNVVATLAALVPASAAGLVRDVTLVSRDLTGAIERVADVAGCHFLSSDGPDGTLLTQGAMAARSNWLMFLRAGAILEGGWIDEISQFVEAAALAPKSRAALFRYARSPHADFRPRDVLQSARRLLLGPTAEQGLVISRAHYDALGGHSANDRAEAKLLAKLRRHDRIILRSRIVIA